MPAVFSGSEWGMVDVDKKEAAAIPSSVATEFRFCLIELDKSCDSDVMRCFVHRRCLVMHAVVRRDDVSSCACYSVYLNTTD
ncbi:hypothetical protein HJC23_013264 [Cyclotella cryptica]|uniref:Uncharacterized protein n=1 Tax=Cyclotella cryptica TaxID=29204 RepID=A0ABD3PH31_9STRA